MPGSLLVQASLCVLEGDFPLRPYISRCKCPTRYSFGSGFSSLQTAGTASGAPLSKAAPQNPTASAGPVILLSSAVLSAHFKIPPSFMAFSCQTAFIWITPKAFPCCLFPVFCLAGQRVVEQTCAPPTPNSFKTLEVSS